jgi:hypothetical protein
MPKTSTEHLRELEDELDAIEEHLSATDSFIRITGDVYIRRDEIRAIHAVLPDGWPSSEKSSPPAKQAKSKSSSSDPSAAPPAQTLGFVKVWALGDWLEVDKSNWTEVIDLLGEQAEVGKVSTGEE